MTLDRLHRLATALTIGVGLVVLWMSGEFPPGLMAGAAAAVAAGPWTWRFAERRAVVRVTNVVVLGGGVLAIWAALDTGNYLFYAISYAVALAAVRSLGLRRAGDFMQAYVLSFLHVVAGAVVNPGLSFGVAMLPYVVLLTVSLMLTHVRRGIEEHAGTRREARQRPADADDRVRAAVARRDLVRPGFLWVTTGVSVAVFLFSLVFFFAFPRLGLGFFAQRTRLGITMSGFSDEVRLGEFGTIVEDPEVVMRVRARFGGPATPIRMRGQSLDHYDGHTWRKTTTRRRELPTDGDGRARADFQVRRMEVPDVQVQEVYLEPMSGTPRVLFGIPHPVAFERPSGTLAALRPEHWRFYADGAGDVAMTGPESVSIIYTVFSDPRTANAEAQRAAGRKYPGDVFDLYTQLPAGMDPGVPALASQVAGKADTPYDAAWAIHAWLRANATYSLDSSHGDTDPLAHFLLTDRAGHCEYFASAMVVMLRALGIPARIVTGFYGGEENQEGRYVAVRKQDAHSWVEVYFPGVGWATFDPTPALALDMRVNDSWLKGLTDAIDSLKFSWYRWVIEYDLEKQVEFVTSLLGWKRDGGGAFGQVGFGWDDIREIRNRLKQVPWARFALGGAAVLLGIPLAVWAFRRRRRGGGRAHPRGSDPAVRAYRRMLRALARAGFRRRPSETQVEFAARVAAGLPAIAEPVERLTWAWVAATYAEAAPVVDPAHLERMLEAVSAGIARRLRP